METSNSTVIHIIGSFCCGKTKFIKSLCESIKKDNEEIYEINKSERISYYKVRKENKNILIYEIPSSFDNNPYSSMNGIDIPKADKIILLYDTSNYDSYQQCLDFYNEFLRFLGVLFVNNNVIICNNKCDKNTVLSYKYLEPFICTVFNTSSFSKNSSNKVIDYLIFNRINI